MVFLRVKLRGEIVRALSSPIEDCKADMIRSCVGEPLKRDVMLLAREWFQMKANKLPAFIYLGLAILSFMKCAVEGYWGIGSSLSLLLTLPWSLSMVIFMWAIAHDGARSLLIFLVPFAGLNFFFMYKMPDCLKRRRKKSPRPAA